MYTNEVRSLNIGKSNIKTFFRISQFREIMRAKNKLLTRSVAYKKIILELKLNTILNGEAVLIGA